MKKGLFIVLAVLLSISLFAQKENEIAVKTDVSEATVFINGAQVHRKKKIDIPAGKSTVKFTNLSPYIDGKSVQVKIDGKVMVLSVDYKINNDKPKAENEEINNLQKQISSIDDLIAAERVNKEIIAEEISFLRGNKSIGGSSNGIDYANLQQTTTFYSERFSKLRLQEMEVDKKIKDLSNKKSKIDWQIQEVRNMKHEPFGEVIVKIDNKLPLEDVNCELYYYVNNAGWYPSYDIRANNITEGIELVYKANILQNTKEDWKNVKLKISSTEANKNNVIPQLQTYFLNYYLAPPKYVLSTNSTYSSNSNVVTGRVIENETGEPAIGATIMVKGTTIGTVTDFNGDYSLTVPSQGGQLVASYVGTKTHEKPINSNVINFSLQAGSGFISESATTNSSGTFGTTPKINIRGATSIYGTSNPLWVLDGVVVETITTINAEDLSSGNAKTLISSAIAGLNAEDIESFDILKDGAATSIYGSRAMAGAIVITTKKGKGKTSNSSQRVNIPVPVTHIENKTSVEFDIKKSYTILSQGVDKTVIEVARYSLPADYEYYSIPKIEKTAFLTAKIADWQQYNLLEGEANIFFENTYVGKTLLELNYLSDTLNLSLGKDRNVIVQRDIVKEYQSSKFMGSKHEQTRAWKTIVRNNKKQPIKITIFDQIPVSISPEIEVITEKLSNSELDKENGKVKWTLNLQPSEKQDVDLQYKVKYSKGKTLHVE